MKIIYYSLFILFALWVVSHPNIKYLLKGLGSVFIDAPIAKAKSDFRAAAEEQARRDAEARMKQIDAAIAASDQGTAPE